MKGLTKQEANSEANDLLNKLNMREKRHNKPHELSGGMKRKVSLGIALVGISKVLVLDEPTSGMDPEARREIWDLLLVKVLAAHNSCVTISVHTQHEQGTHRSVRGRHDMSHLTATVFIKSMRGSRTILITTHFMEEADVLGDRIAIMDHGRVHCYGTSLFLKKLYGAGYHLKLMKQENCNIELVSKLVHEHVPSSTLKSDLGSELWFNLPSDQTAQFPDLFDALERGREEIGVGGLSVAVTTLEEVFLSLYSQKIPRANTALTQAPLWPPMSPKCVCTLEDSASVNPVP
uniref:(California timema) hypothetical protein n=1 Tax=Timema californicum TaxID=61474 RepID=A0A7R9JI83_TIMCA|nr:unnamed protein product [Timema californicum]